MRLVCLSDTHNLQDNFKVPEGDVLIHAGDFSNSGNERDVQRFAKWLDRLPHQRKVVIAGNHDWLFVRQPDLARAYLEPDVTYLQDSGCGIDGLRFWGSPWQPWFMDWAFNLPRNGPKIREKWNLIPMDTDVLITHGPPRGILDQVRPQPGGWDPEGGADSGPLGCEELAIRLHAVCPRLHVFGHIHGGYGHMAKDGTLFVNASICDECYRPVNLAVIVDLEPGDPSVPIRVSHQPSRHPKTRRSQPKITPFPESG